MARLIAAFGTSHSPMLAARQEDWLGGIFTSRDRARLHVDLDGTPCRYDDLLARAPRDAAERIAPALLAERHRAKEAAMLRLRHAIQEARLDALVVIGDDQEEVFDASNMPAIGIFHGPAIRNKAATAPDGLGQDGRPQDAMDRARGRYQEADGDRDHPCHPVLARHLIEHLQAEAFDLSVMDRLPPDRGEGHAFSYVHSFCMGPVKVPVVPLFLNAYYPPNQPTPARCHALGAALARAIAAFGPDLRIGVLASGGLSHFVVDEEFDRRFLAALARNDTAFFRAVPLYKLQAGSSEMRNWICLAGAAATLALDWMEYVPGYRTPALTGTGLAFASFRQDGHA